MFHDDLTNKQYSTYLSLKGFCKGVFASGYVIRIVYPDNRAETREVSQCQLLCPGFVKFLRAKNMQEDAAIYIRPDATYWVMVDFDEDGYERLKRLVESEYWVNCAVQTSPWHVQAWVKLKDMRRTTVAEQDAQAKRIAERFGGDIGSARASQFGRAPGFFNRKPQYLVGSSMFPLVQAIPHVRSKLRSDPILIPGSQSSNNPLAQRAARAPRWKQPFNTANEINLRDWLETVDTSRSDTGAIDIFCNGEIVARFSELPDLGDVRDAYDNALTLMRAEHHPKRLRSDGDVDRSWQDRDVAMYIQQCGYSYSYTVAAIALGSQKAAERDEEHRLAYARNRTDSALNALAA